MKPWALRAGASTEQGAGVKSTTSVAPLPTARRVEVLDALFAAGATFWRAAGRARPRVCQFVVDGDAARSWFIAVDARGGRARMGVSDAPDVVWESDEEALAALFAGRILAGRVRVRGDFELVRETFAALAAAT